MKLRPIQYLRRGECAKISKELERFVDIQNSRFQHLTSYMFHYPLNDRTGGILTSPCLIPFSSFGEIYDPGKHTPGTEVKAITYSNMQIHRRENGFTELFVIVDI